MAKSCLIGEMRTKITVKSVTKGVNANGRETQSEKDVFSGAVRCKWVNAHGTEVIDSLRLDLREVATITMPYTDKITPECLIYRESETEPFEVISIDNVSNERRFLEIKVKRRVKG